MSKYSPMSRQALIVSTAILASACAARRPPPQLVAETAQAEAAFRAGCYTCLKESLAISERHLQTKQPPVGTQERAFDAAVLIAIRDKELGIPGDAAMTKARQLVLPTRQGVLDAAELFIGDTTGLDAEQRAQVSPRIRTPLEPDNPKRRALDVHAEHRSRSELCGAGDRLRAAKAARERRCKGPAVASSKACR